MKISPETIHHIATLSRIKLNPKEADLLSEEVGEVLGYINSLNEVDTTNISPRFHAVATTTLFRDDIVGEMFSPEEAVQNAPESEKGAFIVPRILG